MNRFSLGDKIEIDTTNKKHNDRMQNGWYSQNIGKIMTITNIEYTDYGDIVFMVRENCYFWNKKYMKKAIIVDDILGRDLFEL